MMKQPPFRYNWVMKQQPSFPLGNCAFQRKALAIAVSSLLMADPIPAATFTVQNNNDSGPGSLRQTISDTASGDEIDFDLSLSGSTITLSSRNCSHPSVLVSTLQRENTMRSLCVSER